MISIVNPKDSITRLWGKQSASKASNYRLMKYVLRTDYNGKVLMHNVITGQLVVLDASEVDVLCTLPAAYSASMDQLISDYFLVPEDYDEHKQVIGLRTVLQRLSDLQWDRNYTRYTILPTTGCNARCYYCFEQGVRVSTMSEETVNHVVEFISSHCGENKTVSIMWFGGEPTIATKQIDHICEGLQEKGVRYISGITTNGFLLDENLIPKAKSLWNLQIVKISVDGIEQTYNQIKSYKNANGNPYKKVMSNIGLLLENGITVSLRMNFDISNYSEFYSLANETAENFGHNKLFHLHAHPVNGEYKYQNGEVLHGNESWFTEKLAKLNAYARDKGLSGKIRALPSLRYNGCVASDNSALIINPNGELARCPEQFEGNQIIGDLRSGIVQKELSDSWKKMADYDKCRDCIFYPYCDRLVMCEAKDRCSSKDDFIAKYKESMIQSYDAYKASL